MAEEWRTVTKAEFDAFVKNYPRPLERGVAFICEPPCIYYLDRSIGGEAWESMVAKYHDTESYSKDPKDRPYVWEPNEYKIKAGQAEPTKKSYEPVEHRYPRDAPGEMSYPSTGDEPE